MLAGNDEKERGGGEESLSGDFSLLSFIETHCVIFIHSWKFWWIFKRNSSSRVKFARVKYYFYEFDNFFFFFFSFFEYGMTFNCRTINNCFRENRKYISFPLRNRLTIRFCWKAKTATEIGYDWLSLNFLHFLKFCGERFSQIFAY